MIRLRLIANLALCCAAAAMLPGCVAVVAGAAVKAGTTVAQDRPLGQAIDDVTMSTQLSAQLASRHALYQHTATRVVNGMVLLTGYVPDQQTKDDATRIASSISGVRTIANELEVGSASTVGGYLDDVRISDQIRAKVLADRSVAWVNYNITTTNGTVYLLGLARNESELERVTLHARTIPGVKKVVSYVEFGQQPAQQANLN